MCKLYKISLARVPYETVFAKPNVPGMRNFFVDGVNRSPNRLREDYFSSLETVPQTFVGKQTLILGNLNYNVCKVNDSNTSNNQIIFRQSH